MEVTGCAGHTQAHAVRSQRIRHGLPLMRNQVCSRSLKSPEGHTRVYYSFSLEKMMHGHICVGRLFDSSYPYSACSSTFGTN